MRRIVVVAHSAEEAETARSVLRSRGIDVDAVVIESEVQPSIEGQGEVGEPDPHHLERLATLGTLTAGTAHEVNNLLTHVLAMLYDANRTLAWLEEAGDDKAAARARLRRDIDGALDACYQLRALARGITQYSSLGGSAVMETDLAALIDEAIQIAGPALKRRARIAREIAPETPRVWVNPSKLCQVFVNLLTNAAHAVAAQGKGLGDIRVATSLAGDRVRIDVEDSGCGIPPSVASRIFDPFFTTKTGEAGTGLGLAVSRTIVDQHEGELRFSSEVGIGTTFSVYLPAAARREN